MPRVDYRLFQICWVILLFSGCTLNDSANDRPLPMDSATKTTVAKKSSAATKPLLEQIDEALDITYHRRLNTRDHAAWQIVHGCIPYRTEFLIRHGDQDVPALEYLFNDGKVEGWEFEPGKVLDEATGRRGVRAILRPGSNTAQGHPDQWLGYLASCDFPLDKKIKLAGREYTLGDYLAQMEWDVPHNVSREYSWTLMALVKYHPHDYTWTAADGNTWSVAKLVESELQQDVNASACGGSHRMVGLALANKRRQQDGAPAEGVWRDLETRLHDTVALVKEYQNADGTLSSAHFARAASSPDLGDSLSAAGHVLEFLTVVLTDDELREPWVTRAVEAQCKLFRKTKTVDVAVGGLYHSASALRIYRERMYGPTAFGDQK